MVQDPNFWRRFSVAVHNDEAAILAKDIESGGKPGKQETKHAYVVSLSSPIDSPSSATTPTSQCHLSPAFPPPPSFPPSAFARPLSAPAISQQRREKQHRETRKSHATGETVYYDATEEKHPPMIALHKLPSCPQPTHAYTYTRPSPSPTPSTPKSTHFALPPSPPSNRNSKRTSRFRFGLSSHPPSQPSTPLSSSFGPASLPTTSYRGSRRWSRHPNGSRLSLGVSLSGRPKSAFRFWTTITADATHRDSWLEGQQRKARQRTYMCWAFWLVFLIVVVGGVVAVLVLKGKGVF